MVEPALLVLATVGLLVWIATAGEMVLGGRTIRSLRDLPPVQSSAAPAVTVVIAARNEQAKIEPALASVLRQDYPALEVIVVDDRSTDATSAILDRMELSEGRLRVVHVHELPPGWLGKNHALLVGAGHARGDWLLFTDADVVLERTAISRAIQFASAEGLDHLTVAPELDMPGSALDVFGGAFAMFFARYARPWKARDPGSKRHVGIGAFNLVRAEAYRATGGHRRIAMRPDDDMKLAKILKQGGYRQDVLFGRGMVSVEWYGSLGEAVRGLEKNAFAALEYSVAAVATSCVLLLVSDVWPFVGIFVTDGATRLLHGLTVALTLSVYAAAAWSSGSRATYALAYPLAILVFVYILLRSTVLTLKNDGIRWRETHYSLRELRANRV